ncbi:two-component system sensor histidine kinase/response regulator fusion protein [Arcobacter venerupis]|uniref:histidine kinase n=1 Tax=Arcobacter venerupis TaxID=1054033 RepID=A0AAE7BAG5_9BACT|nr:response regulator [Arcobacter venerupis]QKF66642.1 two-component system sensor histidine kinase/response regulator fusion protein [Arcobacter venerupis]RWS49626.1 hybrid sensor histidine kinase/response regulator [Arcobacter venerupis]
MKLKSLFMLLFILNTFSFISVAFVINKYQKATIKLEDAYKMQYKSLILADELRQSSDDLTRMARTYVITGNPMFEEQYKTVLGIRNGELPRPKRYNGIFWDFYTLNNNKPLLDGEKIPLRELMIQANFPESELNLLFTSQNESDELTNLEHKAINAIKGKFLDKDGNYTIKGEPDFVLARELMHSDVYHLAKIRIMEPLDRFYKAFENRTKQKIIETKQSLKEVEFSVNVIVLISIILFLMSFFIILFRIVYPIDLLRRVMLKLSRNDMSVEIEKNKFDDEVGDMIGAVEIFKENTQKLVTGEYQLKQAMEDAKSANQAKSIFLARMSHELRTPLNAILGFTNILKKSMNATPLEKDNLNIIKKSADHLLNIINEILELSKIEAGKIEIYPKNFDFFELIKEIEDIFAFRCEGKNLKFNINLSNDLPNFIKADEQRLRQILINLLGNSLKFTNEGEINLNIYTLNNMLFFEVKDTGIGIDIKNQEKIFKPFEQVKLDNYTQQGTGLGLAITKELITLMGGTIYVKSKLQIGSEFYFSINFKKANIDEINIKTQIKEIIGVKNQQNDKTILVVDDIKENRDLIVQILSSYGFKTLEAISGNEALELFDNQNEKIDLIFMDILMEDLDGLQTIQIIRKKEKNSNIPIIALTANVFEEDKKQALNAGANDFLPKPVEEKDILIVLEKYLQIELEYEIEQDKQINDFKIELQNLPKEFFEKLNKQALLMNNEKIIFLLKEFNLSNDLENHIKHLIKEFKYQELIDLNKIF